MPHNMLSTLITELHLTDVASDISTQSDIQIELKALSILDEQVRAVADELNDAKTALSDKTQAFEQAQTKLTDIVSQINTHESYALKALKQKDEALALAVAEKIASLEASHADIVESTQEYEKACEQLSNSLHQNEVNLFMLKQQIDTVKATESVHKAQIAMSARYAKEKGINQTTDNRTGNVRLRTARHAFLAMQDKGHTFSTKKAEQKTMAVKVNNAKLAKNAQVVGASNQNKENDLHQRLVQAGIAEQNVVEGVTENNAQKVLARIKNKPS